MATLLHTSPSYTNQRTANWWETYKELAEKAEFNRSGWAATALSIQGCVLSPVLLLTMAYLGGGDWQFLVGQLCFLLVLVPILSAQRVKYILLTSFVSFAIQLGIIFLNVLPVIW